MRNAKCLRIRNSLHKHYAAYMGLVNATLVNMRSNLHGYSTIVTKVNIMQMVLKLTRVKKASKGSKIRNRYNQVPHLTQDTNWKVTNSQMDTTNESQEVIPFPAGDHNAHIN